MDTEKQEDRLEYLERMSHRQFLILREYKEQLARLDHLSSIMRMDPLGHLNLSDNNPIQDQTPETEAETGTAVEAVPEETMVIAETTETAKPADKTETETVKETELVEVEVKETAETIQEEMTESEVVQQAEVVVEPEETEIIVKKDQNLQKVQTTKAENLPQI